MELRCPCGTVIDADDGEDALAAVERHLDDVHAHLLTTPDEEDEQT